MTTTYAIALQPTGGRTAFRADPRRRGLTADEAREELRREWRRDPHARSSLQPILYREDPGGLVEVPAREVGA